MDEQGPSREGISGERAVRGPEMLPTWRCFPRDRCWEAGVERFLAYVIPVPEAGCWLWTGTTVGGSGYGSLMVQRKRWIASRFAWTVFRGPIPDGLFVCHKCDTPPCVNPDHLFLGTFDDNMADRERKGRNKPYLTPLKASNEAILKAFREIKEGSSYAAAARRLGVTDGLLFRIRKGQSRAYLQRTVEEILAG